MWGGGERASKRDIQGEREREQWCGPWGEERSTATFSFSSTHPLPSSPLFSHYLTHFLPRSPSSARSSPKLYPPHASYLIIPSCKHTCRATHTYKDCAKLSLPVQKKTKQKVEVLFKFVSTFSNASTCVCRWRVMGKIAASLQVCVLVCVTCTTEGEGLTVGDKASRPARCDYHPLDPLSLSNTTHAHTLSLFHICIHNAVCCRDLG